MSPLFRSALLLAGAAVAAFSQASDTPFQNKYFTNISLGDSVINLSNTGASSTIATPVQNGNICVNIYALAADNAAMLACCSCQLAPNTLVSVNVLDLLGGKAPTTNSAMVKLMASNPSPTCNAATVGTGANVLVTGMTAWGGSPRLVHTVPGGVPTTYAHLETPFTPATLSAAELTALDNNCLAKAGAPGICSACKVGGQ